MTAGVSAPYHWSFGWETYNWSRPSPGVRPASFGTTTLTPEAANSRALALSITCTTDGVVSVAYGRRSGSYGARTSPVAVSAGVAKTIRLTDLIQGATYYVDPLFSCTIPNSPRGEPIYVQAQYGELSAVAP